MNPSAGRQEAGGAEAGATPQGLGEAEVRQSRLAHGENVLTPPRRTSLWKLYLDKYRDPIIQILLVAAAISLVLAFVEHDFLETIGIFVAVFLATTIGFYFERDAAKRFSALTALGEEQPVKVRRGGRVTEIPRRDVVVGDIVIVEVGDEVPADGRLTSCHDLQIDESQLTGEPVTTKRMGAAPADEHGAYPSDVVLRSTMVLAGRGEFRVEAVGDATEIGKVSAKSAEPTHVKTPLNMQLDRLARRISQVGSAVAVVAFLAFLVHDIAAHTQFWTSGDYLYMAHRVLGYFMMAVTLIVMAVPEGLPMAVTLALALNMRRMLKSNNLVRKLHACETMGAVNVICTDKTGTLTQNKMQVADMVLPARMGAKLADGGAEGVPAGDISDRQLLYAAIAVNTTAELDGDKGVGNPTEVALLRWLQGQGCDYRRLRRETQVTDRVPFSTERKYMKTMAVVDGHTYTFVKGAPEIVMDMAAVQGGERQEADQLLLGYQRRAMRTLAFTADGRLQALAAIADPVRPDVPMAVEQCRKAGIEVKIVTGDTAATAVEVGREIGLFDPEALLALKEGRRSDEVITGPEWAALPDDEAASRATRLRVMARARPGDKQRLVELLQRQGAVVAVTGDGTNDAPALHYAHVGLSLGSGTSVAKEASDMTLLDDSFKSIANAVMWGRSLYRNIQRFLFFQLVVNLTALLVVLGGAVVGTVMPLTVTQILWVNLIMDTFAAMALASLPPSREVMGEKPRDPKKSIITKPMAAGIAFCGLVFAIAMLVYLVWCERLGDAGGVSTRELTCYFTTFVMLQFWNLFNAKCFGSNHSAFRRFYADRGMMLVLAAILLGQWLIVTFGGDMFRTVPLTGREWLTISAATSVVLWAGELWRWGKRMAARRRERRTDNAKRE